MPQVLGEVLLRAVPEPTRQTHHGVMSSYTEPALQASDTLQHRRALQIMCAQSNMHVHTAAALSANAILGGACGQPESRALSAGEVRGLRTSQGLGGRRSSIGTPALLG